MVEERFHAFFLSFRILSLSLFSPPPILSFESPHRQIRRWSLSIPSTSHRNIISLHYTWWRPSPLPLNPPSDQKSELWISPPIHSLLLPRHIFYLPTLFSPLLWLKTEGDEERHSSPVLLFFISSCHFVRSFCVSHLIQYHHVRTSFSSHIEFSVATFFLLLSNRSSFSLCYHHLMMSCEVSSLILVPSLFCFHPLILLHTFLFSFCSKVTSSTHPLLLKHSIYPINNPLFSRSSYFGSTDPRIPFISSFSYFYHHQRHSDSSSSFCRLLYSDDHHLILISGLVLYQ